MWSLVAHLLDLEGVNHNVDHHGGHIETKRNVLDHVGDLVVGLLVDVKVGQHDTGDALGNLDILRNGKAKQNKNLATVLTVNVRNCRIQAKIHLDYIAEQCHHHEAKREMIEKVRDLLLEFSLVKVNQR